MFSWYKVVIMAVNEPFKYRHLFSQCCSFSLFCNSRACFALYEKGYHWDKSNSIQPALYKQYQCISLTVLFPFPFKCKPLSKSGEDTRLWLEDGPGEPVKGRRIICVLDVNGFWRVAVKHLIQLHVTSSIISSLTATPKFIVIHLKGYYCVCSAALPVNCAVVTLVWGWPASKRDKCCSLIWYQLGIGGLASSFGHTQ